MDARQNSSREVTVVDVFYAIKKRIKLIAFVTLIAIILGAAGGVALTLLSNAEYGTTAEYRIKSTENNDVILSYLKSDKFAEKLLLDQLDEDYIESLDEEELEDFEEYMADYNRLLAIRAEAKKTRDEIRANALTLAQKQKAYDDAKATLTELDKILAIYVNPEIGVIDEDMAEKYGKEYETAYDNWKTVKAAYEKEYKKNQELSYTITNLKYEFNDLKKKFENSEYAFLKEFRNDPENVAKINAYKNALTFTFEKPDAEDVNSAALLLVDVNVPYDRKLAEEIVSAIPYAIPEFVEFYVSIPDQESETVCTYISVFDNASSVNYQSPIIGGVEFALIAAVVVFALMCFGVAFIEISFAPKSKKELAEAPTAEPVIETPADEFIPEEKAEEAPEATQAEE